MLLHEAQYVSLGINISSSLALESGNLSRMKNLRKRFTFECADHSKNILTFFLSLQPLWDSGPESRRSSWSISRAPSLHRRSQSGEMESLLSDMHACSIPSSREQSLDQSDHLQVPMLFSPDCNGTTFHLPDLGYDEATSHYPRDQEEEEIEEVKE